MVRAGMFVLGIGLLILWLVGLGRETAGWLMWFNFVAGILSIIGGFVVSERVGRNARVGLPIGLSAGLFVLWIIALATDVLDWKAWWTFAFACAYLLLGIAGASERRELVGGPTTRTTTPRPI